AARAEAAAMGDMGDLSPSADPQWLDASSIRLLQRSYEVVRMGGFELVNADCVLLRERPRTRAVRVAMGARLAGAMGVDIDRVTVRATTTDELGFTGRGAGFAAEAVPLRRRADGDGASVPDSRRANRLAPARRQPRGRRLARVHI